MEDEVPIHAELKKPPRKPRPSEIAAKAKKAVKKKAPKSKKKVKAPKKKKPAKKARKRTVTTIPRPERLDMRLSKAEKTKVIAKAKKMNCTITDVVYAAIEQMR